MSTAIDPHGAELAAKLAFLREQLAALGAGAIRLRGADWFAWATGGVDSPVQAGSGCAAAELLVTRDEACILTDEAEAERLRHAGLPDGLTFHVAPWAEPELHQTYARGAGGGAVLSDRPQNGEGMLPAALRLRRAVLLPAEQERYRVLGRAAAEAVTQAVRGARADWTECDLAAAAAAALWQRGIEPAAICAAGARRLPSARHALPSFEPLGRRALLSVGARRHGLVVRLTRGLAFGRLSPDEQTAQDALLHVEGTALDAVRPGIALSAVYHALDAAYRHANRPDAIRAREQGGLTGYAPRELLASPSTATGIEPGMAFALCPSFPDTAGAVIEDSFLLGDDGLENLSVDPLWPATTIGGRARPVILEAT